MSGLIDWWKYEEKLLRERLRKERQEKFIKAILDVVIVLAATSAGVWLALYFN